MQRSGMLGSRVDKLTKACKAGIMPQSLSAVYVHLVLSTKERRALIPKESKEVKTASSRWLKKQGGIWYGWQSGYGSFSVSESLLGQVSNYIDKQEEHHKEMSFKDEFRKLLSKHRIDFDEDYVWD